MKPLFRGRLAIVLGILSAAWAAWNFAQTHNAAATGDRQATPPESQPQPDVPRGKVFQFTLDHSQVFPGTARTIEIYVPTQYAAEQPACVYVNFDGLQFEANTVFDRLIHDHEMPVTIAIGISPGITASARPPRNPRFNRSLEYDDLGDDLSRFVLEEVLPEVERHKTPDGLRIRLSRDPNDRAAGGASSGGIAAFTLAWRHPEEFRRVFSAIGSFVGMRGGDHYPVLVRKTEPKPLRIFLQDNPDDEWPGGPELGDWWPGNETLERALEFSGYQVAHAWGQGGHDGKAAAAVFPEAMRWLWRDRQQPITAGKSRNTFLEALLLPGEPWRAVRGSYQAVGNLAVGTRGEVLFRGAEPERTWKIDSDGGLSRFAAIKKTYRAMAFGPDGRLYVAAATGILAYAPDGKEFAIAEGIPGRDIVVNHLGALYVSETDAKRVRSGKLWYIDAHGNKAFLDDGLNQPSAVTLSPDGLWLAVADGAGGGYSYRVRADGSLEYKQRFYQFETSDSIDDSSPSQWAMDWEGRLYSATRSGVQVFDRNGRVRAILPVPGGSVIGLSFGGARFDRLFVSCSDHRVYTRKLKVQGALPWSTPIELPTWGAG